MKKILSVSAALLAALLLLAACRGEALPEGMDEETLFHAGKDVMLLLVDGEYEAVHEMLREDQRELFTAEDIADVVASQLDDAGEYKQIDGHMTTGQTINGERYGIAVLYCDFSEEDVLFRLSFDAQWNLVGFSLDQQ